MSSIAMDCPGRCPRRIGTADANVTPTLWTASETKNAEGALVLSQVKRGQELERSPRMIKGCNVHKQGFEMCPVHRRILISGHPK